jgi:1,4-alpha-glucan branching enzyme
MERTRTLILIGISLFINSLQIQAADSVDVTFRYKDSHQSYLVGEFNGWNNSIWPMSYNGTEWFRTARLAIGGNPNPPANGIPGAWQYKFYYNDASPWPNDPLNHHVNPDDQNNSFIYTKDPTIYHFLPNQRQGIIDISTPTISAYIFPKVGTTVDTSNITLKINDTVYDNLGSYYNSDNRQLSFTPPGSFPDGNYTVILDVGTNSDTVNFIIQTESAPIKAIPSYANHGVTLPNQASNDSTTFRLLVGGTNVVILRVAPMGQPVSSAQPIIMRKDISTNNWWMNLDLSSGTYEYLYQTDNGNMIYDPWGRWNGQYGSRFTIGPEGLTADDYMWQTNDYQRPPLNQLIIYELNLHEFAGGYYNLPAPGADFTEFTTLIPYFDSLGVNAIELMPINDYASVGESGYFSWGYDLNHYFALEPSFGAPREFKVLVDSAHAKGIAVIVDVVFNHQNDTGPLWQMWPDEAANPYFKAYSDLRYNEDNLFFFKDMDHWTPETQEIVYESLKMWIDEYRVDGFRYDFTQGIGWNVNEPDKGILGWANKIAQEYNGEIYQIAEHLPESPALMFYSGLTSGWHDSYHDEIFKECRLQSNFSQFENLVLGLGAYSGNDTPSTPSNYANRTEPVNMNNNHDEQSLIYEMNHWQGVPLDEAVQRDKLYATFMFTSLGIPMLWQGIEFSAPRGWTDDNEKLSYRPLEWSWLSTQRGQEHYHYFRSLIFQRKNNPALYEGNLHKLYKNNSLRVLVWGFDHPTLVNKIMAIANLSNQDRTITNVPWLDKGDWYNIFDQSVFTVSSDTVASMTIPAYTALVYANAPDTNLVGIENNHLTNFPNSFNLNQNYPNPFNPETTIEFHIPKSEKVALYIYNILGQKITTLTNQNYSPGIYHIVWDGKSDRGETVSSGIYIIQMRSGEFIKNRRMLLLR